ncbi:4-hydroxybenzoate polyprenyltransferase/phosphoserine phosphatase [Litorivivens lipolytica]|uniref:4-hydroxybenzoate polyprenyltransferase/phosphoserine phosphatase n=1 Tax=Litorivivens lipolytica TaxID=1524264 RepID=A0A7W4W7V3_9GAMM|nr:4-hydroxybenzoate polyprenyltransferase/phosphoserine phosphatase [Litorivivens lipolytica]
MQQHSQDRVLAVDLDGTLLRSDMLLESFLALLKQSFWSCLLLPFWLLAGKARLKREIASRVTIDAASLPYCKTVLEFLKQEKAQGRRIVLATATTEMLAQPIADHLGLFDEVLASDEANLSSETKRATLVERYGEQGFDYIGNSSDDLAVWRSAATAYTCNISDGLKRKIQAGEAVVETRLKTAVSLRIYLRQLRIKQWVKNFLIFVPLLASHQADNAALLASGVLAFVLYGLCSSSVYLINDLMDLADDRQHRVKRFRPLASGDLGIGRALLLLPLCLLLSFGTAVALLPIGFAISLGVYFLLSLLYTFYLKQQLLVDVLTLAGLYTMRVICGAFLFALQLTFWLLAFSMFIFLSLALIKRYAELHSSREAGRTEKSPGRAYYPGDLEMIAALGAASGYLSVLILALYIHSEHIIALYRHPEILWLACPILLFWVGRMWMLAHRGEVHEDPVLFAVADRVSLISGFCFAVVFWLATGAVW